MIILNITKNTLLMVWWVVRLCQKSFSRNPQLQMFKLPNSWLQIILIQPGKSIWAARARETKKNTSVQQLWPAYNQISKRETRWKYNLVGKYKQKTVCYHFKCFCPNVYTRYHRHLDFCLDHLYLPIRQQINKVQRCALARALFQFALALKTDSTPLKPRFGIQSFLTWRIWGNYCEHDDDIWNLPPTLWRFCTTWM